MVSPTGGNNYEMCIRDSDIPMQRHRLLKVEAVDGTYIWDIGIGQRSPKYPLRLAEGLVQKQCGEVYKLSLIHI